MQGIKKLLAIATIALVITGCNDDDDPAPSASPQPDPPPPAAVTNVRVVHASADAPTVDILANGAVLAGLENVDYQVASPWIEVEVGTYDIAVEANLPGDDANVIEANLTFAENINYEIIALGSVAAGTLGPLVIENTAADVAAGNVRVQVVHAAANAPTVDIYVTGPDDPLDAAQPLATAAFMDFTGQVEVPEGDYRIRITPAGSLDVVFDSGSVFLLEGADLLVLATDNVDTGDSPVTLVLASAGTFIEGIDVLRVLDVNATADLRVVHAVADAPAVDVIANNALTLVDALAFPGATDYLAVEPGGYLIDVAADADNSIVVIDDAEVSLTQGERYTAIANNDLDNIGLALLTDDNRSIVTAAKVRIIHASPSAGDVDIYVTADGIIDNVDPAFAGVPFDTSMLAETGYVELAAGDYVITVTAAGTKEAAIETDVLSLVAGGVYTAIAVDGSNPGDAPQLITLDGLAPMPDPLPSPNVRVVHASADAPTVNVYANDALLGGLIDVDYQVSSSWIEVAAGDYALRVEANLPAGGVADVITASLTLEDGVNYEVIALGSVAAGTLEPLVVSNATSEVMAGNVQVQIVHAAQNAPEVDVYVTAPGADLASSTPVVTAAYKQFSEQLQVPGGDYQIRIAAAGTQMVVFDSGTVALPADTSLLVAATESILPGTSPVTLLVSTGSSFFTIEDMSTPASLRVVHAIADAPAVDVIANDAITLFDGPAFLDGSEYLEVTPDTYSVDVVADADNSVVAIADAEVPLMQGMYYTAIANNTLAAADLDLLVDMPRSIATEVKVRIIHASPTAGDVDIYVTADGEIDAVDPAFAAVPYSTDVLAETGYVSLAAGDYVVTVTATGSKTEALETGILSLTAGGVYTAIAVDGSNPGDAPQLILLDDFIP